MTKEIDFWTLRDKILDAALDFTKDMTGTKRDRALFDFVVGACKALHIAGVTESDMMPWLFVLAVRGGDRVAEAKRMLETSPANLGGD